MASTPPRSKLSCKQVKKKHDLKKENSSSSLPSSSLLTVTSTPSSNKHLQTEQDDYSPVYFPSTQETSEEIDVLWDWHSPQTSQRRKKQKRLLPIQSPKYPIKRHPSNNQIQNFEKLRDELKALKEELAVPDDESCLCVSPNQETEYKKDDDNLLLKTEQDQFDDLFNDSIDEQQLILFSQKIENDFKDERKDDSFTNICDNTEIDNIINKYSKKTFDEFENFTDSSFDNALSTFHLGETKMEQINITKHSITPLTRTLSDNPQSSRNIIQTVSGKLEFHRTKSFELATVNHHSQSNLPRSTLEEIEKKRLEAKARLASKKKQEQSQFVTNNTTQTPTKCSPEEIEKKRLQALAKREAKRLQDIVEKNRQEALKRLQISRSKNANLVKSTLSKRL